MSLLGLAVVYGAILFYIMARFENIDQSKNRDKTERKIKHFFNLWLTGYNIVLLYIYHLAINVESFTSIPNNSGILLIAVLTGIATIPIQIIFILAWIGDIGGKIVNYFTERD